MKNIKIEHICDRCGKTIPENKKPILGRIVITRKNTKKLRNVHRQDLCAQCYQQYEKTWDTFMANQPSKTLRATG